MSDKVGENEFKGVTVLVRDCVTMTDKDFVIESTYVPGV